MKKALLIIMSISVALSLIVAAFELQDKDSAQSVYAKYYFTPAFKASVPFDPSHLIIVEEDAKALVAMLGDPGLSEEQFEEGLEGNLSRMNLRGNGMVWAHSDSCGSSPLDASARKAVFCVRLPDRLFVKDGGWSLEAPTMRFALDFSKNAYLTAIGQRPKECVDTTPYAACSTASPGMFCDVDPEGEFTLVQDCRGFDMLDPSDDCGCPDPWICASDGVCTPPI